MVASRFDLMNCDIASSANMKSGTSAYDTCQAITITTPHMLLVLLYAGALFLSTSLPSMFDFVAPTLLTAQLYAVHHDRLPLTLPDARYA